MTVAARRWDRGDGAAQEARVGVRAGFALAPRGGVTLDRLAPCADAPLYAAKCKGRGSVVFKVDNRETTTTRIPPRESRAIAALPLFRTTSQVALRVVVE